MCSAIFFRITDIGTISTRSPGRYAGPGCGSRWWMSRVVVDLAEQSIVIGAQGIEVDGDRSIRGNDVADTGDRRALNGIGDRNRARIDSRIDPFFEFDDDGGIARGNDPPRVHASA